MAPLLLPFVLFFTTHRAGLAIIPPANAFASPALKKNDISHAAKTTTHRRRSPPPISVETHLHLRMADSPPGGDHNSHNVATTTTAANANILLPLTALVSLSLVSLAALTHHLPGPLIDSSGPPAFWSTLPYGVIFSGSYDSYTPSFIIQDVSSTVLAIVLASIFVKSITGKAKEGVLEPRDARKLIHTLSAPLFILMWPIFSNAFGARVFASIVPFLNALKLLVASTSGDVRSRSSGDTQSTGFESELAGAISRSGDAKEALGGPFIYVLVLLFSTLFFWTDTPIGIVSVATMAVGDGLADLIGRRYGSTNKWSFNKDKTMAGSAAFVAGSFVGSLGLISWLTRMGTMDSLALSPIALGVRLLAIAIVCAGVELIPVGDDNWSVPISAAILSAILLN